MRKTSSCQSIHHINPNEPLMVSNDAELINAFHFWQGASGKRYIHSVYSIYSCPELPKANFILVNRKRDGSCEALMIGATKEDANSLNLAYLRKHAARHHANEIHIHVMTNSDEERRLVHLDLLSLQEVNGQNPALKPTIHVI